MGLFKEYEVRKMIDYVTAGQMTFSRMVELLNIDVFKHLSQKNGLTTMMDVVRCLESFLVCNENTKNETKVKLQSLIQYLKSEVVSAAKSNLNN